MAGLSYILDFMDHSSTHARKQVLRLSQTHTQRNLNIYRYDYHYWMKAIMMRFKAHDPTWDERLTFFWREVIFAPREFYELSEFFQRMKLTLPKG